MSLKSLFVRIPEDIWEDARNAVVAIQENDPSVSMCSFVTDALEAHVEKLKVEHNEGKSFPPRPTEKLRTGRRLAGDLS